MQTISIKPYGKGELIDLLRPISRKKILDVVYDVLMNNRNISIADAKKEKVIWKPEVEQVLDTFGFIE